jgi:hypothetical protein
MEISCKPETLCTGIDEDVSTMFSRFWEDTKHCQSFGNKSIGNVLSFHDKLSVCWIVHVIVTDEQFNNLLDMLEVNSFVSDVENGVC